MENVFMAIVEESRRIDRLEMAEGLEAGFNPHPALRVRVGIATGRSGERIAVRAARVFFFDRVDRNRLNPVNRVLQHERLAQRHNDLVRQHRI